MKIIKLRALSSIVLVLILTAFVPTGNSLQSQTIDSGKVWFGPSIGSLDLLQLFTNEAAWDSARSQIDVYQFLTHHVNSWPCMGDLCNSNTLSNLVGVQAFQKLDEWGIDICVEGAGILPLTPHGTPVDCELEKQIAVQNAFNWTADAINNVYANGGTVQYIAIDEPIRRWYSPIYPTGGGPQCKTDSLAEIAAMVAEFITMINNAAPWISVGQIILYPELDVEGIKTFVTELENLGINLPFIHLDVHGLRIIDYTGPVYGRVTLEQVRADLLELETFLHNHSIAFAPILIDLSFTTQLYKFGEYTNEEYYIGAMNWINKVDSALGRPDHVVFESWATPQYSDTNLIHVIFPDNLPEDDTLTFSHTRLLNEAMSIFSPPPSSCCVLTTGNVDNDPEDNVDISDLTKLIDYLFITFTPPVCLDEANIDGIGSVDIADLTRLIDFLFISFTPLKSCE